MTTITSEADFPYLRSTEAPTPPCRGFQFDLCNAAADYQSQQRPAPTSSDDAADMVAELQVLARKKTRTQPSASLADDDIYGPADVPLTGLRLGLIIDSSSTGQTARWRSTQPAARGKPAPEASESLGGETSGAHAARLACNISRRHKRMWHTER